MFIDRAQSSKESFISTLLKKSSNRRAFYMQIAVYALLAMTPMVMGKNNTVNIRERFDKAANASWNLVFEDPGTGNWKEHWFLDGHKASITDTARGMNFAAGPEAGNDADHAVLWTKRSFKGNIRIQYDYTRTDHAIRFVDILYIEATGAGPAPYVQDIAKWSSLREPPAMSVYFNHMKTYHISYAAFGVKNDDPNNDYVRARRYMPKAGKGLKGTALSPDYKKTGLFLPGMTYKITVIKWNKFLFMRVRGDGKDRIFHWNTTALPPINKGRVGLRHMYTRSARYRNIRISVLHTDK